MKKENHQMNLKIGLIGCGNIAKVHLGYVSRYVRKASVALCDRDEVRLQDFAQRNGIAHTFTDIDELFKQFKPDIVHILTPPSTHRDIAVKCLENKCHVLIEKPMCLSENEADDIIAAARKNERLVCIDHMRLFDPQIMKVKELLQRGELGTVVNVRGCYSHDILAKLSSDSTARWTGNLRGGMLFDVSPHLVYLVEDLLPGLECRETVTRQNKEGILTDIISVFSAPSGTGVVHMSLNIFPLQNYIAVECTRGVVTIDLRNFVTTIRKKYALPNAVERVVGNISVGAQLLAGTAKSLVHFALGKLDSYSGLDVITGRLYEAVLHKGSSPVPAEKGKILARLTEAMFPAPATAERATVQETTDAPLPPADVLVTGGTGFIGKRLIARLAEKGLKVRVLTHQNVNSPSLRWLGDRNVQLVQGDIYHYRDVEKACRGVSTVYHLAAAMKGDWNYFLDTTISGTKNVMNALSAAGGRHLVYVSTLNVQDAKNYPHNGTINEEFPYEDMPEKRGNYSNAKLKAEKIVLKYKDDPRLSIAVIRPGLVYGPGGPAFLKDVGFRFGKNVVVTLGMGTRRIPLVYLDNLIDALVLAGEAGARAKGIFNVVDGEYPSQRRFSREYRKITGEKFLTVYIPMALLMGGFMLLEKMLAVFLKKKISFSYKLRCVNRNVAHDTRRIENALGWKQRVSFEEGLAATIESASAPRAASASPAQKSAEA